MMRQTINAYEFERHAGCKTKHPNNHIFFENGKTIYAVVQELKSTPQEMLFDVIQNVTGSAVNQKNFNAWKGEHICFFIQDLECYIPKNDDNEYKFVTLSPFFVWYIFISASYQAATRELQRIYGKDDLVVPS